MINISYLYDQSFSDEIEIEKYNDIIDLKDFILDYLVNDSIISYNKGYVNLVLYNNNSEELKDCDLNDYLNDDALIMYDYSYEIDLYKGENNEYHKQLIELQQENKNLSNKIINLEYKNKKYYEQLIELQQENKKLSNKIIDLFNKSTNI